MKKLLVICGILIGFTNAYSQNAKAAKTTDENKIYTKVQKEPKFNGDIGKYIADNLSYTEEAQAQNVEGTVYVSFVVEKDGSISTLKILKGIEGGAGHGLEKRALVVVGHMPKWTPGMENGKPVRVQFTLPVKFVLNDSKGTGAKKSE